MATLSNYTFSSKTELFLVGGGRICQDPSPFDSSSSPLKKFCDFFILGAARLYIFSIASSAFKKAPCFFSIGAAKKTLPNDPSPRGFCI
jgi:hypothetical protein